MFTDFDVFFGNELNVISLVAFLSAISVIISSLEWLSLYRQFKDGGVFSWSLWKSGKKILGYKLLRVLFESIFRYPNVLLLLGIRILAATGIFFFWHNMQGLFFSSLVIAISSILFSFRGLSGTSGADQMSKIVFSAMAICLSTGSVFTLKACLIFLSLQLIIAYSTTGWLRIMQPTWRDGSDLRLVLRQQVYGNKFIWKKSMYYPRLTAVVSLFILLFECLIGVAVFLPTHWFIFFLLIGVFFHLANAVIMGLNTFFWTFVGVYPAIIWTSYKINLLIY